MRICYLAPAESSHIQKWTERMSAYGHDVHVVSLHRGTLSHATTHVLGSEVANDEGDLRKLSYLSYASKARRLIRQLDPDVLHAHYASSYGLLAALCCDRPYHLSVWGSDIYEFPRKSPIHNMAIRFALGRASWLMSTSVAMANEASRYTRKSFDITPFGVDMELFAPSKRTRCMDDKRFVVGTVKALESKYGLDVLLRGVAGAIAIRPDIPIEVRIAGRGSQLGELQNLAYNLGIAEKVTWLGYISQAQAAIEWANMDVAIVMSVNESFGVSSVEAQASGVPVVYSDIPGLTEAADSGRQGICLRRGDSKGLARTLVGLYENEDMRTRLGQLSRKYVSSTYEMDKCFKIIETIYRRKQQ